MVMAPVPVLMVVSPNTASSPLPLAENVELMGLKDEVLTPFCCSHRAVTSTTTVLISCTCGGEGGGLAAGFVKAVATSAPWALYQDRMMRSVSGVTLTVLALLVSALTL